MNLTPLLAQHILETFEGNNWTDVNIKATLQDVTCKEAATVIAATQNSIAALTYHLQFYNEIVLERLKGNSPAIDDTNGFNVVQPTSEEEWKALQNQCSQSFHALSDAVKLIPDEKLWQLAPNSENTFYKTLHGIAEHAHYHLGQIVLLKKVIRKNFD
ncbi:MAG: DinB family protein [Parafilimonas sp.]